MFYLWLFEGKKEVFYYVTHSTHFIYGYMASDIWYKTIQIAREETRCPHYTGFSFRLAAMVLIYIYHHTSRGALAGIRNSSMGPP